MPSYKRIYIFAGILYIIVYNFLEILYFKKHRNLELKQKSPILRQ